VVHGFHVGLVDLLNQLFAALNAARNTARLVDERRKSWTYC